MALYLGISAVVPNCVLRLSMRALHGKVIYMKTDWAEENLQTIRTLMERSAIYRRALAPIMVLAGTLGSLATFTGLYYHLDAPQVFGPFWFCTAGFVIVGGLLIARQQAIKQKEKFWSPPTRRIGQALIPPLLSGLCLSLFFLSNVAYSNGLTDDPLFVPVLIWLLFYGLALHAAGFFMPRGIKLFGWVFIVAACALFSWYYWMLGQSDNFDFNPYWLMGFFFGGLHLAYGAYLYLTERKNPVA